MPLYKTHLKITAYVEFKSKGILTRNYALLKLSQGYVLGGVNIPDCHQLIPNYISNGVDH